MKPDSEAARRPSLIDVATAAGVSRSAASRALLGQVGVTTAVRDAVAKAAADLGYVKDIRAHALKATSTSTIGIVVRTVRLDFYAELIAAMQDRLEALGYSTALTAASDGDHHATGAFGRILGLRPDAIIVASGRIPSRSIEAVGAQVPVTAIGPTSTSKLVGSVADDGSGTDALAQLITDAGHRKIGVVMYSRARSTTLSRRSRLLWEALERRGLEPFPVKASSRADGVDPEGLRESLNRITALMCPNDPTLIAAWNLLDSWGVQVPDDLALTGYDGLGQVATPVFGLTTWRQDVAAMAEAATRQTLDRIAAPNTKPQHVLVQGSLLRGRTV
ncbi:MULTISPECIES: LacI family DNA-binding transcriptional regulator [unclassified Leifsonia]|uniref:LacI family DNA-binding transcriptional regulator n=1 Tax=unclassified Leifsonia TaxID=2663824 RepID=UPI000B7DB4FE|nr:MULTISPECIES: LacI family DNA-binding transcriptional regulator [unclassified Leifsonia]